MKIAKHLVGYLGATIGALTLATAVQAQDFPNKPITIVAPFPPGGSTDASVRVLLPKMSEVLGQPVVIDNRPGSSGTVGSAYVARSQPDGYTLVWSVNAPFTLAPFSLKDVPYKVKDDFKPVGWAANTPLALAVHPSLPVNSVAELIEYAKANPGQIKYGSAGIGSAHQIIGETMKLEAGIDMVHVPYQGGGPAIADLVGGQIMVSFGTIPAVVAQEKNNALKILALAEEARYSKMPDTPTIAETVPGAAITTWIGLLAPAGTPDDVVAKLRGALSEALKDPAVIELYDNSGLDVVDAGPEELSAQIDKELTHFADLFPKIGITPQ